MGQDFSVEDLNVLNLKPGLKLDEAFEQLLANISRRVRREGSGDSPRFLLYTRHRTRHGAPTVNRQSYGEEDLARFAAENDGFPLAATEREIQEFDRSLLQHGKKRRKPKVKKRSRSLTEVASLANLKRLPAPSRPKFLDKLITGATNLGRKASPDSKQKAHSRRQLLADRNRFVNYLHPDPGPDDQVSEVNGCSGGVDSPPGLTSNKNYSRSLGSCASSESDSPSVGENRNPRRRLLYERQDLSRSAPILDEADCDEGENEEEEEEDVFGCEDETISNASECHPSQRVDGGLEECILEATCSAQFCYDDNTASEVGGKKHLKLDIPSVEENWLETRSGEHNNNNHNNQHSGSLHLQKHRPSSVSEVPEFDPSRSPPLVAPPPDLQATSSPITPGHVKRQQEALFQQLIHRSDDQTPAPRQGNTQLHRSRSELPPLSTSSSLRSLSAGASSAPPLSPQTDRAEKWMRSYHSQARSQRFSKAVMAKGYVKALAEQINHQGALVNNGDDVDDDHDLANHDKKMENDSPAAGLGEDVAESLAMFKDDAMRRSLVKNLIEAAERHKTNSIEDIHSPTSPTQTPSGKTTSPSESLNKAKPLSPTQGKPPSSGVTSHGKSPHTSSHPSEHSSSQRDTTSPGRNGDRVKKARASKESSLSPRGRRRGHRSGSQSPRSSPRSSPRRHNNPRSPQPPCNNKVPTSPSKPKPVVDYSSKPKFSPEKRPSLPSTLETNSHPQRTKSSSISSISPTSPTTSPNTLTATPQSPEHRKGSNLPPSVLPKTSPKPSIGSANSQASSGTSELPAPELRKGSDSSKETVSLRDSSKRNSEQYRDSVFNTIYDNGAPLSAAELFDSSWSDSDSYDDDFSDEFDEDRKEEVKEVPIEPAVDSSTTCEQPNVKAADKRYKIADELLRTERGYVDKLHLLHQVFYFRLDKENRQQSLLPPDTLNHMFSNTKSIFLFHHDFLLPQLEARMKNWEEDPRIGDLMKKNAPFLKMYTEYIRNYNNAMNLINQWMEKSTRFAAIIHEIQKEPECRGLSLLDHMLDPIQRIPRYELLLKDYVKHLPEDSPDMKDAADALDLVTKAACHSNEAMKKIETFRKLLDIYQSLRGVAVDFISPTREFVCQGPVIKISARGGERQPRHIFLFNDLLLVCNQYFGGTYGVKSQLEVDCMELRPGPSMHIQNTFLVHSTQKAVELLDENPNGEKIGWEKKIGDVIASHRKRKRSIKIDDTKLGEYPAHETSVPESCLGKTAPVWIPDDAATMCMLCELSFNMVRRRHHCRSCGKLICKSCCKKAPLEYRQGKIERVCLTCYDIIVNKRGMSDSTDSTGGDLSPKKKGVLQVKASEPGLISGYVQCSEDGGRNWQKLWLLAHKDFALYTFRAHEDISAISSLPLPGYTLKRIPDLEGRQHLFCLMHKNKKICVYQHDNEKKFKRWWSVLEKLVHAELPDQSFRFSSQSNSSNGSSCSDNTINNNNNNNGNDNRYSTHSGSQADSGYPGDSNNSLAQFAGDSELGDDEVDDDENADGISQYDNVDGVVSE
ncbi:FYVE, RhoGEF and PH domain-containing protein 1 [Aplysia californica]|uniref:FYVE, RhoGEF and PH domain-containing protein 1 n=1 Tax=Aplysia californica TaxID=6500 RepID=A0ABM0JTY5_APLCA|nr:FYVE, RhoGEF and PH domain-containing protein 1 [Aplysia californica]XP_012939696.1 FYVE, RhoGEF and PH domain-containing protein 1 [Aplysia californica]